MCRLKDLITNDANFSLKTTISQSNFLHLVKIVLTRTWYLFDHNFMGETDGVAMGFQHHPSSQKYTDLWPSGYGIVFVSKKFRVRALLGHQC